MKAANSGVWHNNWQNAWHLHGLSLDGSVKEYTWIFGAGAVASAMGGSVFSNDSWNNITFISGEVKNPQRNIGLSLFLGTLIAHSFYKQLFSYLNYFSAFAAKTIC